MKETARNKERSQETPHIGQLALAAMFAARETLYETVVHAGMRVLAAMLEEDRTRLCGPRYEHDLGRSATRAGSTEGELAFAGRRIRVRRPRVRNGDGKEVALPTWKHFTDADPLTPRAVGQMVLGVSTRNYERSLEPLPASIESRGTSKSAVSRRFVSAMLTSEPPAWRPCSWGSPSTRRTGQSPCGTSSGGTPTSNSTSPRI